MLFLRGVLGLVILLMLMLAAMQGGARVTSKLLGLPRFRWFPAQPARAAIWRRFLVRAVSSLAPLLVCVLLISGGYLIHGDRSPSTTVEVMPGPAERAGALDGDRVISIDGVKMESWEAIHATLRPGAGKKTLELERAGSRRTLVVTTGPDGRIGIRGKVVRRELGLGGALRRGLQTPLTLYAALLKDTSMTGEEDVELRGPVSVLRTSESMTDNAELLSYAALLGIYIWPWLMGLHVLDAATLALFTRTHAWALNGAAEARLALFCRLHQALGVSLLGSSVSLVLSVFAGLPLVGTVVMPFVLLLSSAVIGTYVLAWMVARERWRQRTLWVVPALPFALIPCAAQVVGFVALGWVRSELKRNHLALGWFTAAPAAISTR